jgi:5-methylcytosine-specific restriction endonuclease McrA
MTDDRTYIKVHDGLPEGTTVRERAMPLDQFSEAHRAQIQEQVAQDRPPNRWLSLGSPEDRRPMAYIENRGWWEWHWQRGADPEKRREKIEPALRRQVIARDGHVCQLCGGVVEPTDVHLDHKHPVSRGGLTSLDNLQVSHSRCNLRKGARV